MNSLKTKNKDTLVAAINEVNSNCDDVKSDLSKANLKI